LRMARYDAIQAAKLAQKTRNSEIAEMIRQEERIRFHAQTEVTDKISSPARRDFLAFVHNLIPEDKFNLFTSLFRYPVATNEICGIIFDRLSRIFDGKNAAFNYEFADGNDAADWEMYRRDKLREPSVWSDDAWERFRTDIDCLVVVDMPTESVHGRPEPYFYFVSPENLLSWQNDPHGALLYAAFRTEGERVVVIDGGYYRVYDKDFHLVSEREHPLGYCPCAWFWNVPLSLAKPHLKWSPISRQLSALDWWLFFHISKQQLDLFGAYPIYSGYASECDYADEDGNHCSHGFLKDKNDFYAYDENGLIRRCPVCAAKRITGAGSYVEVPVPVEGQPDLRNPVQKLDADVEALNFNVSEEDRLRRHIINASVGSDDSILSVSAVNDKQIDAEFESKSVILRRVKVGFERIQTFVDATICRLRYGVSFRGCSINYGTDFFTLSGTELRSRYKSAKESGASESELDAIQTQIVESDYRSDPRMRARMRILAELEPYRHLTVTEAQGLYSAGLIDERELRLKVDFTNYVAQFERENTDIVAFGASVPYKEKIETIRKTLLNYADKRRKELAGA
jgi:hypothetical protein